MPGLGRLCIEPYFKVFRSIKLYSYGLEVRFSILDSCSKYEGFVL